MLTDYKTYEVLDAAELARRWHVPVRWIREQTRERATDPLPHVRLGKYVLSKMLASPIRGPGSKPAPQSHRLLEPAFWELGWRPWAESNCRPTV
jgi:hypothetical protein